jgi:hypothetical protein
MSIKLTKGDATKILSKDSGLIEKLLKEGWSKVVEKKKPAAKKKAD